MAFCQMPCVLREAEVCMRLFAGIRTRPAVAGMVRGWARSTGLGVGASALRGGALPADDA